MPRTGSVAVYILAFFSGSAALIYEITWAKMLALTFGSTTLSIAAVVAAFMGGMGLGARGYEWINHRFRRPLLIYGCLELGIALSAAALTLLFYSLPTTFAQISASVSSDVGLNLLRFGFVFVLLLVPAALMGATFPALCTVIIHTTRQVDRHLGMVYGINTIGGAAGVILAGLFLIERLGLQATVIVANGINLAVACAAFALLSTSLSRKHASETVSPEPTAIPTDLPRSLTGWILFASGFATLSYEIFWFRALHYLVGNSTYAITTILFIFLIGLGLGSLLLRRAVKHSSPERDLALCQFAIAALALLAMTLHWGILSQPALRDQVSIFSNAVRAHLWWQRLILDAVIAVITLLPATLFMGLSFPLASRLYIGDVRRLDARIGNAYLLANLGGILGSILGAVFLLPRFGTLGATKVSAILNLVLGLMVVMAIRRRGARPLRWTLATMGGVAVMVFLLPASIPLRGDKLGDIDGKLTFMEEGDLATVQVIEDPKNPALKAMEVNGCKIGWSQGFRGSTPYLKQIMLAHLPMTLDTRIRRTLNIGLGSAVTLKTLADYAQIQTLDCVEISRAVVRASHQFPASGVLEDPRVHLTVDDAVHFLIRGRRKYDLIISDGKQHPFFAGNATMLCREFYRSARRRLDEDGLFVQWVTLGMLHEDLMINLKTLSDVFDHVDVFYFPKWSVFFVASQKPLAGRPRITEDQFRHMAMRQDLETYQIDRPMAVLAHWVAGKAQFNQLLDATPISTWDHLILDFTAFKASAIMRARSALQNIKLLRAAEGVSPSQRSMAGADWEENPFVQSQRLLREAYVSYFTGRMLTARSIMIKAMSVNPDDHSASQALRQMDLAQGLRPQSKNQ